LFLLLIVVVATQRTAISEIISIKPLLILGEASYGMYILHNPLHYVFARKIAPALPFDQAGNFVVYFCVVVVVSVAAFFLIEVPAREFIKAAFRGGLRRRAV